MKILETYELRKYYGKEQNLVKSLDGVNLSVYDDEFVAVVGTSGSGKSTLLHVLGGLNCPSGGTITVDGKNIFHLKDEELTIFCRRKIGFMFQSYNLVPMLNAYENILLPIELDGARANLKYIDNIINILGLEKKRQSLPSQLSDGQQ